MQEVQKKPKKKNFSKGQGESRVTDTKKGHITRKIGCLPKVTDGVFEINFCAMVRTEASASRQSGNFLRCYLT